MRRFYCRRVCFMHPRRFVSRRFITENGGYFGRVPYPATIRCIDSKAQNLTKYDGRRAGNCHSGDTAVYHFGDIGKEYQGGPSRHFHDCGAFRSV